MDGCPPKLDPVAYYGLAGEFVQTLEPHTEADPAGVLIGLLIAFGDVVGRCPYYLVDGQRHYLNLFAVLVGKSSRARKTTALEHVKNALREVEPDWADARILSGLSSGEGLIYAVRDPVEKQVPVKDPKTKAILGYDTVIEDPGEADKRLLVAEPEFARTLKVTQREANTLSAILRQAWDSGNLRVMTKTPLKATEAHISLLCNITAEELKRLLTETDTANGFANRFLWAYVQRSKLLPNGGELWKQDLSWLYGRLQAAVRFAQGIERMYRDEETMRAWAKIYPHLTRDEPGLFGSIISRAESQTLRLSCLYALLDSSPAIRLPHLEAALALWGFCEESVRFLFGDALGDPVADEILRTLRNTPGGMTRTELFGLFGRNLPAVRLTQALEVLEKKRLVGMEKEETNGRFAERWRALA